jgi:tetratricopeptide (TPR) repeat protein
VWLPQPIKAEPSTPPQPSKPPKPSYYRLAKAISDTEEGATTGPKYKQVVGYYLKSLKASPKMPGAGFMYYALSDHLDVAKGQTKRSVLQKAVKAIPTYYLMYFDLGYEMNGEEADYKTSLYLKSYAVSLQTVTQPHLNTSLPPSNPLQLQLQHSSTNYNLGLQKKSVGNYDGALEHFRTFCTNSPLDELGYNNMALTFKSADRENEAFATYLKALPLTPNRFRTYISLGAFLTIASALLLLLLDNGR